MEIDRESGVPPWRQVEADLKRRIEAGEFTPMLPPERDLTAAYGVAPMTLKKALRALREAGLIATEKGYGSRVLRRE